MAYIKNITYAHVGRNEGCLCDRCGQYIQNIITVHYTDGVNINYGTECYDKLCKSGKLTAYGVKLMKKALSKIKKHSEEYEIWKTISYEKAREKGWTVYIDEDSSVNTWSTRESDKSVWCGRPFEEYREWMLKDFYPARFKEDQKLIDRFAKINFER